MTDTTIKILEASSGGTDLAGIAFTQGATPVKAGKQHMVHADGSSVANGNGLPVTDGGGSLTVDGSVTATVSGTVAVSNFPATQTVTGTVQANNLVGGTAVSNANPLPISDAGSSITVDGSVTATLAAGTASIGNIGTVSTITNPVAVNDNGGSLTVDGTLTANQGTAGASPWPVSDGGGSLTVDGTVSVGNFPATQGVNLTQVNGAALSSANPVPIIPKPNELAVTAVGAAAAAVTATLAAVPGQFHYIDAIEISCYASAAGTGGATPVTVTSTNLPGNNAFTFPSGRAIGTIFTYTLTPNRPVRSATAGTATTIVCPATTGVIWRVNVFYTTAP